MILRPLWKVAQENGDYHAVRRARLVPPQCGAGVCLGAFDFGAGQGRVGGCSARTDGSPDAIASQNPTLPGCGIIPRIALYGIIGLSGLDELSPRDPEACSEIAMLVSCIFDGKEP